MKVQKMRELFMTESSCATNLEMVGNTRKNRTYLLWFRAAFGTIWGCSWEWSSDKEAGLSI